jgi:hypothetical protein
LLPSVTADVTAFTRNLSAHSSSSLGADNGDTGRGQLNGGDASATATGNNPLPIHITGFKQRIEAFVYQRALEGEELGVGHLFQASAVPDKAPALDALVRILHRHSSLVETLVAMSKLSLHKELSSETDSQAARVSEAVSRFHRFRSALDEATITAVHALDDSHLLMLMQVASSTKMPLLVLYNWSTDSLLFVDTVLSIKVLICLMWCALPWLASSALLLGVLHSRCSSCHVYAS